MDQCKKEIPSTTPDENKETAQDNILDDEALEDVSGGTPPQSPAGGVVGIKLIWD